MSESFVPLAAFLRPPPTALPEILAVEPAIARDGDAAISEDLLAEYTAAFSAIRRFRAGLEDALDASVQRLLVEIAENVVARELEMAAPDIAAIVAKARERAGDEPAICARVHPTQRAALSTLQLQTHVDDRLAPTDVVLELRSGTIDVRLRTRLAIALAACGP